MSKITFEVVKIIKLDSTNTTVGMINYSVHTIHYFTVISMKKVNTEKHNIKSIMKHFDNLHKNTDPQNRIVFQGNYKLKQSYQKLAYLRTYKKLRHRIVIEQTYISTKRLEISPTHTANLV